MGDDVEDDVNPLVVRGLDKVAELLARPEMRIYVEEVLDAVAVVTRLEGDLFEDRADPQGRDAEPPEVTEFALQPPQRSALPARAGAEPRVVIDPPGILGLVQGCRAALHGAARSVAVAAFFVPVGEAVEQQEVQYLVLPRGRGRRERPPRQGGEIHIEQAFLNAF